MARRCRCGLSRYSIGDALMSWPQHLGATDVVGPAPGNNINGPPMRLAGELQPEGPGTYRAAG
jgi:hypothetical protein